MKFLIESVKKDQVSFKFNFNFFPIDKLVFLSVKILYEDERRLLRKNTNKDSLNSESSSDSEEREVPSRHGTSINQWNQSINQ